MKTFKQFIAEQTVHNHLDDFVQFTCNHLGIEEVPQISLVDDKSAAYENRSFASYYPDDQRIEVNIAGRHPADIMRSLAHELVHHRQRLDGEISADAADESGKTGSVYENEANSEAGIIMRNYAQINGGIFEGFINEISFELAGKNVDARFKEVDRAYDELNSWKRLIPGRKKQLQKKIAKANRGIRLGTDTQYRRAMATEEEIKTPRPK